MQYFLPGANTLRRRATLANSGVVAIGTAATVAPFAGVIRIAPTMRELDG
jgi:hypothetical protein